MTFDIYRITFIIFTILFSIFFGICCIHTYFPSVIEGYVSMYTYTVNNCWDGVAGSVDWNGKYTET